MAALLMAAVSTFAGFMPDVASADALHTLIFNTYLPPFDTVRKVMVNDFAQRMERNSAGAIKVTIPAASMGPSPRQWDLVIDRVADIAVVPLYTQRSHIVSPLLADLPFNSLSSESASVALWQTYLKYFAKLEEFHEVKLLAVFVLPPTRFISKTTPLTSLNDFRGLKLWVPSSEVSKTVSALGGVPVYSTLGQVFEYVSKGTIDSLMTSPSVLRQANLGSYVKYMTEVPGGFGSVSFAVVMNAQAWSELDASAQDAVLRAAEGLPQRVGHALDARDQAGLAQQSLVVSRTSSELTAQIKNRLAPKESAWLAGAKERGLANPEEALAFYRAQMQDAYAQRGQ